MGKVNVVLANGKTVAVDEEIAANIRPEAGHIQTPEEAAAAARAEYLDENTSGVQAAIVSGVNTAGAWDMVRIAPEHVRARNFAFDVTPARLVTGLVTERGVCAASEAGLRSLFPEHIAA